MRIAVNTRLLVNDIHGGIEWFSFETLKRITTGHPDHEFVFIFDRPWDNRYIFSDNIIPVVLKPATIHPLTWYIWFEFRLPRLLNKMNAGLFLSPDGMMPTRADVPCIPVIHDINFYHRKHDLPRLKSLYYRKYFIKYALKAKRIVTVSEYSKQDMVSSWGINKEKIDVVYNGVAADFVPALSADKSAAVAAKPGGKPYFLFVGNMSPRKNIPNLIRAYDRYRKEQNGSAGLVIAGDRLFLNSESDRAFRNSVYSKDIHFTGRRSRHELADLYKNAIALVFVPWFEGFGIPMVEAMKCGTPVISSNTTCMPEIAGDAALFVNPADTKAIAEGMKKVEKDRELRSEMIKKGLIASERFTWDNTAKLLWQSIEKSIKD